jgi:Tfp pilus assembly protein PilO
MTARDRKILLVIAGLAVLAGFWFLVLKPKRTEAASLATEVAAQQERLTSARQTVAQGLQAKADYPRDSQTVAELGTAVPADDDMPSLLYQLDAASKNADVVFDSLVRASGATGTAATGNAAAAAAVSGNSSSSSSSPSTGSGGSTAPSASLPPGATVGTAGLATLPFTFEFTGSYTDLRHFLGDVQRFVTTNGDAVSVRGRLLTVDAVSLVPASKDFSRIQAKLVATAYLAPEQGTAGAGASAPGSASGSAGSTAPQAHSTSAITGGTN